MGGVKAAPAAAGKVDLRPGVQFATILMFVALLIAADKPGGESDRLTGRHEQHGKITTGPDLLGDRAAGQLRLPDRTIQVLKVFVDDLSQTREKLPHLASHLI